MNEKIKEFYFPIWENYNIKIEPSENHPKYGWAYTKEYQEELFHSNMEKFAELIIKECADICDRFQERNVGMQPAECAGAIRKRFGLDYV